MTVNIQKRPYQNIIQSPFVQLPSALMKYLHNNEKQPVLMIESLTEPRVRTSDDINAGQRQFYAVRQ